jgi:uncharacterized pyridoxamine 5'-phosphate oxidase family protein
MLTHMYETSEQLGQLQELLDLSIAGPQRHLTSIIEPGRRTISAQRVVEELSGLVVLNVATVTATGEPRLSAVDGHFLQGHWYFSTDSRAVKARHLRARPSVSVAYTPRDGLGIWAHGRAVFLERATSEWTMLDEHLNLMYGQSPSEWGDDIVFIRVDAHWMVGFAMTDEEMIDMAEMERARAQRLADAAGSSSEGSNPGEDQT